MALNLENVTINLHNWITNLFMNSNGGKNKGYMNEAYDITPEALTYRQLANIISDKVGKKITYIDIAEDTAREGLKQIGMDDWYINIMIELFSTIRGGYGSETTEAVEDITGRKPISFEQFAKHY